MSITTDSPPSITVQQLTDGTQIKSTINPDGSVYYDHYIGTDKVATSAFDVTGTQLFYSEVQNGNSVYVISDGTATGNQALDSVFSNAVTTTQSGVTGNPANSLAFLNNPLSLDTINTESPTVNGGVSTISGTDAAVANDLAIFQNQNTGSGVSVSTSGALGPGHINTGAKFGLRHFTFVLRDGINNIPHTLDLNINPEDMVIETPYRVNAYNTMAGVFIDVWGQGINRIIIRGHTGWRTVTTQNQTQDGFDNVFALRDGIFNLYFSLRQDASSRYSQSDLEQTITLTLIDRLHETSYRIVPEQFKLLRNRARPLLHGYEASFIVVTPTNKDNSLTALSQIDKVRQLQNGFGDNQSTWGRIKEQAANLKSPFSAAFSDLSNVGSGVAGTFNALLSAKNDFTKGVQGVRQLASDSIHAVNKALGTIQSFADFSGITAEAKLLYGDIKSAFNELACLLEQIKSGGLFTYTGIAGSCGCCIALFGTPKSALQSVPNTFATLKQGGDESLIQQASSAFSNNAQTVATKINNIDTPMILAGNN